MIVYKSFNLTDDDALERLKQAVKGGFIEFDDKSNVRYIEHFVREEKKAVFKLDRGKAEQMFNELYHLLLQLENNKILNVLTEKGGLYQTCRYSCEDAQSAIDSYKYFDEKEFEDNSYLLLYGLFQALIIQQDAIQKLFKFCLNKQIDFTRDYPDFKYIREIRNNTTGHPTDRFKGKKYFLISAPTFNKKGYYLVEHDIDDKKTGKQIAVFPELLFHQENIVIEMLNCLIKEINDLAVKSKISSK